MLWVLAHIRENGPKIYFKNIKQLPSPWDSNKRNMKIPPHDFPPPSQNSKKNTNHYPNLLQMFAKHGSTPINHEITSAAATTTTPLWDKKQRLNSLSSKETPPTVKPSTEPNNQPWPKPQCSKQKKRSHKTIKRRRILKQVSIIRQFNPQCQVS